MIQDDGNAKYKALRTALGQIERQFGKHSVRFMGDAPDADVKAISSGSSKLDKALGIGGWPRGRVVEIYGPESSGKTTLMLMAIAEVQKTGGIAAFVDAEHALDPRWAETLGVDIDKLLISQPDNGEQGLEIVDRLVRSGSIDMLVVDSVAALVPKVEIDGEMGDSVVGVQARLMSQALRKLSGVVKSTGSTLVFINQLRHKIGVQYGSPEVTTGGNALKFYASVRADIRRTGKIEDGRKEVIGNKTRIKIAKNKLAAPFKLIELDLLYASGFDRVGEVIDLALEAKVLEQNGSWYRLEGANIAQGRERLRQRMVNDPALYERLRDAGGVPQPGAGSQEQDSAETVESDHEAVA